MAARSGGLRRSERLRCRRDFERVARVGLRFAASDFVLLVAPARGAPREAEKIGAVGRPVLRLGVTASRRVGGAVVRNRVKRAVREWFRRSRHEVPEGRELVVIARPGAAGLRPVEVAEQLDRLLGRWRRGGHDAVG
jgi:ribonuclease P protein component